MKVSSVNNTSPNFGGLNAQKMLEKAGNINSVQQRIALGIAAMSFQPAIDLCNKDVDEKTRKTSSNRSFAKALVGMTTGIMVRGGCMKAVECAFRNEKFTDKFAKITADAKSREAILNAKDYIKNQGGAKKYSQIIGTIVALGVMIFTNFAIDAPLTNKLTNLLNKKYDKEEGEAAPISNETGRGQ